MKERTKCGVDAYIVRTWGAPFENSGQGIAAPLHRL